MSVYRARSWVSACVHNDGIPRVFLIKSSASDDISKPWRSPQVLTKSSSPDEGLKLQHSPQVLGKLSSNTLREFYFSNAPNDCYSSNTPGDSYTSITLVIAMLLTPLANVTPLTPLVTVKPLISQYLSASNTPTDCQPSNTLREVLSPW